MFLSGQFFKAPSLFQGLREKGEFIRRVSYGVLLTGLSVCVLVGDNLFDYSRCPVRAWLTGTLVATLCLTLAVWHVSRWRRLRGLLGLAALFFSAFVILGLPSKEHVYRSGVLSETSIMTSFFLAGPAILGATLLAGVLANRQSCGGILFWLSGDVSRSDRGALRLLSQRSLSFISSFLLLGVVFVCVSLYYAFRNASHSEVYSEPPSTAAWWGASAALFCVCAGSLRLRAKEERAALLDGCRVLGATMLASCLAVTCVLQLIRISPFLAYHWGSPDPFLNGRAYVVLAFLAVSLAVSAGTAVRFRNSGKQDQFSWPGCILLILLGTMYFVASNGLDAQSQFIRAIMCIDKSDGHVKWLCEGLPGPPDNTHASNSNATPTPCLQDGNVYAYFGNAGAMAADARGRLLWTNTELAFNGFYGAGASPVVVDGKCIVYCDSNRQAYLCALDADTGHTVWKTALDANFSSSGCSRTPVVRRVDGKTLLLLWRSSTLAAYDAASGGLVWQYAAETDFGDQVATMLCDSECAYFTSRNWVVALSLRNLADGSEPVVWKTVRKSKFCNCSSPVISNNLLFLVSDNGDSHCIDAKTGAIQWSQSLPGKYMSSVVAAGDTVLFCSTTGFVSVISCDGTFCKRAENHLDEPCIASFAVEEERLYVRTAAHLYCIGK